MMSTRELSLSFCLFLEICSTLGSGLAPSHDREESSPAGTMNDEDRLFEELFTRRHYNRHSRPVVNVNQSVSVVMGISVVRIVEVNEQNEIFRTNMWLKLGWKDPKLTWEPSDYSGLVKISVPTNLLWVPDIVLFDGAENGVVMSDNGLQVTADGSVDWYPKAIFASYCAIDIALFPFDEQLCTLRFESWSYDSSKLNLSLSTNETLNLDYYKNSSEWDLIGASAERILIIYPSWDMPASVIEFHLHIRRRVLYYWYNLILPCTLISILAACTYILPPDSAERIGLGVTTLLALTVNQLVVADRVPPTSDALPLLGLYFGCVMIMNTLSVMSMVFISNMYNRSSEIYAMAPWMKRFICDRLGYILRLRRPRFDINSKGMENDTQCETMVAQQESDVKHTVSVERSNTNGSNHRQRQHQTHPSTEANDYNDEWKYAALVIDRLCFCICAIYLTIVTLVFYSYAIAARIRNP